MISLVLPYGMDNDNQKWIDFDTRNDPGHGFSHPDNKANHVARLDARHVGRYRQHPSTTTEPKSGTNSSKAE